VKQYSTPEKIHAAQGLSVAIPTRIDPIVISKLGTLILMLVYFESSVFLKTKHIFSTGNVKFTVIYNFITIVNVW